MGARVPGAELINLDELKSVPRGGCHTISAASGRCFPNRKATVRERTEALGPFLEALEMEQKLAAMAQQFEEVGYESCQGVRAGVWAGDGSV